MPAERLLAETDSPYLSPQPRARPAATSRRNVIHTLAPLAAERGEEPAALEARDRRQRDRGLRAVSGCPGLPR